jgi:alanyl-tRNA synthetase
MVAEAEVIGGLRAWVFQAPDGLGGGDLRRLVEAGRRAAGASGFAALGVSVAGEKVQLVAAADAAAVERGVSARGLLQAALPHVDGKGGGKDDMAQGAGSGTSGAAAALAAGLAHVREHTR